MKTNLFSILLVLFLFQNNVKAQFSKLMDFDGSTNGLAPRGDLYLDGTYLYGTTAGGGQFDDGIIFKIKTDGSGFIKMLEFGNVTSGGRGAAEAFVSDGTYLYGTTFFGGPQKTVNADGFGTVYKIKPDGSGYAPMLFCSSFSTNAYPHGPLAMNGTDLYGLTDAGGTMDEGTMYKIKTDGSGYTSMISFAADLAGAGPCGGLLNSNNVLYGMTGGGAFDGGNIFKLNLLGGLPSILFQFGQGTGSGTNPVGTLVSDGLYLYGMTEAGGANNNGVLFKIKNDGTDYSELIQFDDQNNGALPAGSLMLQSAYLYGMTSYGGIHNQGVIFKIKTDGSSYKKLLDFDGTSTGARPMAGLTSDGTFLYGTAREGGANDNGTVFKVGINNNAVTGIEERETISRISIYPNPISFNATISLTGETQNTELKIYDVSGRLVKEMPVGPESHFSFSRGNLRAGVYFIQLQKQGKIITSAKMIVKD